ncbi:MAG: toxic anion resistance protein [Lachnospiraceae bacterium]|nr:toxic anion resistance protein [Lachnospiraceae bacterium]
MDNGIPSLTLEPNAMAAPAAPAAIEAPSMPQAVAAPAQPQAIQVSAVPSAPTLTLNPEAQQQNGQQAQQEADPVQINEDMLTEEEKAIVNDFASKIDISDSNMVMTYGSAAQQHIASFSESALNSVKTKDLGQIGETLSSLVVQLKTLDEPEKKGIAGWFQRKKRDVATMKANYTKAEANVDKIVEMLEQHQVTLMKDIALFDQMYDLNLKYYKELTMYIIAGKKRLAEVRANELQELRKKAEETGAQEDAQAYNDFSNLCDRFEKKLHDLELTRMISIQMGPQTRMLQNNDTLMVEKIQSSIVNTIPLWKSQMVLALGIEHGRQATAAQSAVTNMTNELLKKNAETLKMATIETAKEAERSVVDIETLKTTNENLISTLDEVMKIQTEGKAKRAAAEQELGRIEGELKQKLMELKS